MSDRSDRFTPEATQVLALAQEEAQRFNHNYIGTEHLLLGLVRQEKSVASRVLAALSVDLARVRQAVHYIIGRGDRMVIGDISLTPRAKKVVALAVEQARELGHEQIGTEHLLLGMVAEGEGIAAGVLLSMGATPEAVRMQVLRELNGEAAGQPTGTVAQPAVGSDDSGGRQPPSEPPSEPPPGRARPLTGPELRRFLEQPLVASLGCIDESGMPYVVPTWFEYDGETFWLVPRARSLWARYLKHNPRVCLSIDQRTGPSARAQVFGRAEIVEEPNVGGAWVPIATRMAARYLGERDGPAYLTPTLDRPRWLIRVRPERITTWAGGGWHRRYVEG
ncbi:MAG TPA: Clp protease N-terminal domain-containing protein [Chloroflexota bacterium]|nr:Clp protease N-terminal domain-containing protein [Chloroflexota bacterium]